MPADLLTKKFVYEQALPLINRLPRGLSYAMAARLGRRFFWQHERDWVHAYRMGLAMGFPAASGDELDQWTRAHFAMLARETLDVYALPKLSRETDFPWGTLDAAELLNDHSVQGKIIVMAHMGRPILLSTALGLAGLNIGMLSQVVDERNPNLDEPTRAFLQHKMNHVVRLSGGRWITTADNLRMIYEALHQGESIIIMLDLVESDARRRVSFPFLGGNLHLPPGILRIAQRVGARLYYGRALDDGIGASCSVVALPQEPAVAMRTATQLLEEDVMHAPWQWWQWNNFQLMWSAP